MQPSTQQNAYEYELCTSRAQGVAVNKAEKPRHQLTPQEGRQCAICSTGSKLHIKFLHQHLLIRFTLMICTLIYVCVLCHNKNQGYNIAWKYPTSYLRKKVGAESEHSEKMN